MLTAIIITIVFIYFFLVAKKERKKQLASWAFVGKVNEDGTLKGSVGRFFVERRRFYYNKWIWHVEINLNHDGMQSTVIMQGPIQEKSSPIHVNRGDHIICYGRFNGDHFLANRIEIVKEK